MDLIKSGLGLTKQKHSQILNPTNILMAQIADHFINDLQIDVEKKEKDNEYAEQLRMENDKLRIEKLVSEECAADDQKKSKQERKCNQLLLELLETERKYVQDLEEGIK